jgi:hypothetical protein
MLGKPAIVDLSVGAGALTVPWWITIQSGLEFSIAVGGAVLVIVRIAIAIREWKKK